MTTAQQINAYRRELLEGGMDPDVVNDLVKDAAQTMVMNHGLRVSPLSTADRPPLPTRS